MKDIKPEAHLPPRRYLSREEAAAWLRVSVEIFIGFGIPYCDFGPRSRRWDLVDIIAFADDKKRCDSARTPATDKRSGRQCVSTSEKAHRTGGPHGTTRTENAIGEVLEFPIES